MPTTAIVWFRRDLRVHDHPALTAAHREERPGRARVRARPAAAGRRPLPLRQPRLVPARVPARAARGAARARGRAVRAGGHARARCSPALAGETGAERGPLRLRRVAVRDGARPPRRGARRPAWPRAAIRATSSPTSACRARPTGGPFTVFSPFWRRWEKLPRREVHGAPRVAAPSPPALRAGRDPAAPAPEAAEPLAPGEAAARERLRRWLDGPDRALRRAPRPARRAAPPSSRPTCTSAACRRARPRSAPAASGGRGAAAFVRQLAWRDFYAHVLLHHPGNARHAHKPRSRR